MFVTRSDSFLPAVVTSYDKIDCLTSSSNLFRRNIEQAANVAFSQRNEEALNSLLGRCGTNKTLVTKIETMKTQLSQRKK